MSKEFSPTEIHSMCAGLAVSNFYGAVTVRFQGGRMVTVDSNQQIKPGDGHPFHFKGNSSDE